MEFFVLQILFFFLLIVVIGGGATLPLLLLRKRASHFSESIQYWIGVASSFACGVFLAMSFLGLIPAVQRKWIQVFASANNNTKQVRMESMNSDHAGCLPITVAHIGILIGFTLIFAIDSLLQKEHSAMPMITLTRSSSLDRLEPDQSEDSLPSSVNHFSRSNYVSLKDVEHDLARTQTPTADYGSVSPFFGKGSNVVLGPDPCSMMPHNKGVESIVGNFGGTETFLIVFAVVWHNLFEGATLGLQDDHQTSVVLFLGILLHGFLLSVALSFAVLKTWIPGQFSVSKASLILLILTMARPVGMLFGMLMGSSTSLASTITSACLQSLSAGLFLHISFISLLPAEFKRPMEEHEPQLPVKLCSFAAGWTVMAVLAVVMDTQGMHSHSH